MEVINQDQIIATLTDKAADFQLKVIIKHGRGYVPVEAREGESLEVGYIAIDSIYTPVRNVNFHNEHVRVGQMTNFDKLFLDITTDGTVTPEESFRQAAQILVEQFQCLVGETTIATEESEEENKEETN
ncbi:MAG: hypothetical protein A2458_04845 [Candidatus Kerfeldbacteria bacterium RIFOXYC2_FULL_38_9]|nr:MAG: hypothetical protein A2458_04845 [Candidatus Kerfeldbacteria bacterium RIFOXYC2_FULL_38_9]